MCVAFETVPSRLRRLYWQYSLADIRMKLRLYLSERVAMIYQDHQVMGVLLNQAFGSEDTHSDSKAAPSSKEEFEAAFHSFFSR